MRTRPLSAADLLNVWERACDIPEPERALLLLEAGSTDIAHDGLARLTVGARNVRLLAMREWLFGPDIAALADCPSCGTPAEMSLRVDQLRASPSPAEADDSALQVFERLTRDEYEVAFRLPIGADLADLPAEATAEVRREALLDRCVLEARAAGTPIRATELPNSVIDALESRMDEIDPDADVQLVLQCPVCSDQWRAGFAIDQFLWADIECWAWRTLADVHALARAYGWREVDILAMSQARRERYLSLVDR